MLSRGLLRPDIVVSTTPNTVLYMQLFKAVDEKARISSTSRLRSASIDFRRSGELRLKSRNASADACTCTDEE